MLTDFHIRNYKSLADVSLVLSSILDALWFMRGCATQGVDETGAERDRVRIL